MIEKPKRPKKPDIQERQPPRTLQELINRYDLDNTKVYDFLDELVGQINENDTSTSEDISSITEDIASLQSQINDRNIITAKTLSNYTIQSTDTAENVKAFSLYNSIGNKLTVQNGVIKIGSGVSKVKVSYNATCQNSTSTANSRAFTYLKHNTTSITQESYYFNRTWEQIRVSHNPIIRAVSQGDEFYLGVYGLAGINLMGGSSFCHTAITVEVIE